MSRDDQRATAGRLMEDHRSQGELDADGCQSDSIFVTLKMGRWTRQMEENRTKRGRGRPPKNGTRAMSDAERQAMRRQRQKDAEADVERMRREIGEILRRTEDLYVTTYEPGLIARQHRIEQTWGRLLEAVHGAAFAAFPELTLDRLALLYPMAQKRASTVHSTKSVEARFRRSAPVPVSQS
jgi:hypothetical protein